MLSNVLSELGALHFLRPSPNADSTVLAAWYERKATVLDHLAAEGCPHAARDAWQARRHAADLRVFPTQQHKSQFDSAAYMRTRKRTQVIRHECEGTESNG